MSKLWVFSHSTFNKFMELRGWNDNNLPDNSVFISICTTETNKYKDDLDHWFNNEHENVLNIDFDDIDGYNQEDIDGNIIPGITGLTEQQADILFDFIDKNIGKDFYIHCNAGVSRSQGVARFIMDYYYEVYTPASLRPENPCLFPNLHVVRLLRHRWIRKYFHNNHTEGIIY